MKRAILRKKVSWLGSHKTLSKMQEESRAARERTSQNLQDNSNSAQEHFSLQLHSRREREREKWTRLLSSEQTDYSQCKAVKDSSNSTTLRGREQTSSITNNLLTNNIFVSVNVFSFNVSLVTFMLFWITYASPERLLFFLLNLPLDLVAVLFPFLFLSTRDKEVNHHKPWPGGHPYIGSS